MANEAFSYDDIYDLLRTEKFTSELQVITNEILDKVRKYLSNKQKLLGKEEESTQIFGAQKRATIQLEIENAKRALKDLYEFREKKILNRAVFSVRGTSMVRDTTNMLPHEEEFYNQLVQIIPINRKSFFGLLEPSSKGLANIEDAEETDTSEAAVDENEGAIERNMVKVRLQEDVGEFVAEDLKSYGPFPKDTEVEIPDTIANLLIGQNKAKMASETVEGEKENEVPEASKELLSEVPEAHGAASKAGENQGQTED